MLTKKIEELTLYLIAQDEVDYNISVKLKEQEDRINKLEKQLGSLTD